MEVFGTGSRTLVTRISGNTHIAEMLVFVGGRRNKNEFELLEDQGKLLLLD